MYSKPTLQQCVDALAIARTDPGDGDADDKLVDFLHSYDEYLIRAAMALLGKKRQ